MLHFQGIGVGYQIGVDGLKAFHKLFGEAAWERAGERMPRSEQKQETCRWSHLIMKEYGKVVTTKTGKENEVKFKIEMVKS